METNSLKPLLLRDTEVLFLPLPIHLMVIYLFGIFLFSGKYLATGDHNRELLIWDASSNAVKANGLVFHTGRINSVAWSPDSKHVVTGGLDGAVYVWDVENSGKRVFIKGMVLLEIMS